MANVDDDIVSNDSDNPTSTKSSPQDLSRRSVFGGGLRDRGRRVHRRHRLRCSMPCRLRRPAPRQRQRLGFQGIPVSSADDRDSAEGYTARVLIAWGDPVSDGPPNSSRTRATARRAGMAVGHAQRRHGVFPDQRLRSTACSCRTTSTPTTCCCSRTAPRTGTRKRRTSRSAAHGVGIIEIASGVGRPRAGEWRVVRPSQYARRITGSTPIRIGGPAAGDRRAR